MMVTMRIDVAEHSIEMRITQEFLPTVEARYALFETALGHSPEITLDINVSKNTTTADGPWGECVIHNNFLHFFDDSSIGWCDLKHMRGGLSVFPSNPLNPLSTFLRSIFMLLVMRNNDGICLHGAAILHNGGVFIFVGPSGAGKSTVSRLSAGKIVLSDEQVFIKKRGAEFVVFPHPQWGDAQVGTRENKPYPIRGIFKLVQDKTVFIEPLKVAPIAVAELFTIPDILLSLASKDALLLTFMDLINTVPYFALHFLPVPSFWNHLDTLPPLESFRKETSHEKNHTAQVRQDCLQDCR